MSKTNSAEPARVHRNCSTQSAKREHNPARHKLPKVLRDLPWRTMDANRMWCDCDRILAAVPVCDKSSDPNRPWHYEMAIVTVRCDEGYFATEVDDSPWGWEIDDIDFYVLINDPIHGAAGEKNYELRKHAVGCSRAIDGYPSS